MCAQLLPGRKRHQRIWQCVLYDVKQICVYPKLSFNMEGNSTIVYWPAFSPLCLMFAFLLLEPLYLDVILIAWPSCVTSRQFHKPLKDNFSCGQFYHFPCLYPGPRALLKNCVRMPLNIVFLCVCASRVYVEFMRWRRALIIWIRMRKQDESAVIFTPSGFYHAAKL